MLITAPQWTGAKEKFVDDLFAWLSSAGTMHYEDQVTQLQHALQTAEIARQGHAAAQDIVAALLHDIGHLLVHGHQDTDDFLGRDLQHEEVGAQWLASFFPPEVVEPIRLHVLAKRWLCTIDKTYWHGLSEASKRSFLVQGGKLSLEEMIAFRMQDSWQQAVALRTRDDLAKQPGRHVPGLDSLRTVVLHMLKV
jgi:predicted HD phosphohydrolase